MISKIYTSDQKLIHCIINTESGPIAMREFSYFQYLFITTYTIAYDTLKNTELLNSKINDLPRLEEIINSIQDKLLHSDSRIIAQYARTHIPENDDLYIEDICRENPINISFKGIALILVTAIIISGGKIEISSDFSIKAELPALGTGIFEMRKALYSKQFDINVTEQVTIKQ